MHPIGILQKQSRIGNMLEVEIVLEVDLFPNWDYSQITLKSCYKVFK